MTALRQNTLKNSMIPVFKYANDNKRYHTLNYYTLRKFGRRVFKASVNAGFSCPNIDGRVSFGGCTYCTSGASEFTLPSYVSVKEQIEKEKERIFAKWGEVGIIAYFQANTNTYAPTQKLDKLFNEALSSNVNGISIATRADCLEEDKINLLDRLNKKTYLTVELGLQTIFDKTATLINRGHDYKTFLDGYRRLKDKGIRVCVHIINGLPGETKEMMVKTAEELGKLKPDGVKIHLLHIMKNTKMAQDYENGLVIPMTMEDYIETVCRQLCYLPEETVIERITGDGSKENLIAPKWSLNKIAVLGGIDKFMNDNNLLQGMNFKN